MGGARHNDLVGSWSLGGPSAEVVTSETKPSEEALERRTRRTLCGRPCGNPGVTACCLPWPRVRLAQLDREASCWSSHT